MDYCFYQGCFDVEIVGGVCDYCVVVVMFGGVQCGGGVVLVFVDGKQGIIGVDLVSGLVCEQDFFVVVMVGVDVFCDGWY